MNQRQQALVAITKINGAMVGVVAPLRAGVVELRAVLEREADGSIDEAMWMKLRNHADDIERALPTLECWVDDDHAAGDEVLS